MMNPMPVPDRMTKFALTFIAIAPTVACDPDPAELGPNPDEPDLSLRDGRCDPLKKQCNLTNSFYLGLGEYGIDNLPLANGADPDIVITKIWAPECTDPKGLPLVGDFFSVAPVLSVDDDGNFGSTAFEHIAMPWVKCTVEGSQWLGTQWWVQANAADATGTTVAVNAKLRIADITTDPGQSTLYRWESNHSHLYGDQNLQWEPTCDEDPDPGLDFHSVVYPYLRIDGATGEFTHDGDTAYLGCTSGLVAKSGYTWGYYPEPVDVHEAITYAGMAHYCGPLGESYTETGTPIAVWNKTGSGPDQNEIDSVNDPVWTPEAAWNDRMTAICIGTTRLAAFQPEAAKNFDCGSFTIPPCTEQLLDDSEVMLVTYAER